MKAEPGEVEFARQPHQGGAHALRGRPVAADVHVEPGLGGREAHVQGLAAVPEGGAQRLRDGGRPVQVRHGDGASVDRDEVVAAGSHQPGLGPAVHGPHMQREAPPALPARVDHWCRFHGEVRLGQRLDELAALPGRVGFRREVLHGAAATGSEIRAEGVDPLRRCALDGDELRPRAGSPHRDALARQRQRHGGAVLGHAVAPRPEAADLQGFGR